MKHPFLLAAVWMFGPVALAKPVLSVKEVRTVFDGGSRGDSYFNSNLRGEMRRMGIRFVAARSRADATLRSGGRGTNDGGFSGFASLVSPTGQVLWSAQTRRQPGSRVMAFDSLAQKLRAARR